MKRNLKLIQLLFFALFAIVAQAQQKTVSGAVVDDTNQPLPGVAVVVSGTTKGTVTNIDGRYQLMVDDSNAQLTFSFIGFTTQTVDAAGKSTVNVTLQPEMSDLDEVVVVGYGTMKKSDLSGASVSVGESAIKGSVITNLDQSLQGRAAGVTAVTTSGAPGSSSSIRVRGQASINANAEPLYVIDGVIIQGGGNSGADFGLGDALGNGRVSTISPLSTINPSDIVSMEILKDASATAIYGAQGANGVVLITTKRGKAGDAKFTYEGMVAMQRQMKRLDMMNLREYANYYNTLVEQGVTSENASYSDPSLLGVGTNWQDAIFQTAFQHQHQISAQGGSDKVQYYVSGSFMNQDGTIIGSNFERFSLRTNLDAQLKPWFKLGLSATYAITNDDLKLADSDQGLINYSLTTLPDIPIYNVNGDYSTVVREGYTNPNPIALAMMDDILLKRQKLNGNVFADITPITNLTWHAELGYDLGWSRAERYKPMVDLGGWVRSTNEMNVQNNTNTFWQLKNYITYNVNLFEDHNITAMVGQECWESKYDYTSVYASGLPSDAVHNPALGTKSSYNIGSGFGSSSMASFFARFNYNYKDRYLATYTYRYDGSSNFGPDNRWAGFHSVAGSWRFSNETFFESLKSIVSNGKLRVGWGQTGNSNIGAYAWGSEISRMPSGLGAGYRPANIANTAIQWESQEQINVGLDLSFLDERISFVADWYQKTSNDMLMSLQLPSYMGTQGNGSSALAAPKGNYGSIENTGLELTLTGRPFVGQFEWESSFQISFNKNKLKSLSGTSNASIVGMGQWSDVVSVSEVGKSLYNFYGYKCEGVYKDLQDIQDSPKTVKHPDKDGAFNRYNTIWVGDIKFKDVNGDGKIDENDRTDIGSPMPDFTFGWTNTFRYKNFDLSVFINGSYGNKVMNYMSIALSNMKSTWTNQLNDVAKDCAKLVAVDGSIEYADGSSWFDHIENVKVANEGTKIPRPVSSDPNDNDRISDRYVEDGSYIRLKNITLGYTLPKTIASKLYLDNVRVYTNIQNLLTLTNYSGYDPEIGASTADANGYTYGLDNGRYPSPTVFSFGLNVTF